MNKPSQIIERESELLLPRGERSPPGRDGRDADSRLRPRPRYDGDLMAGDEGIDDAL